VSHGGPEPSSDTTLHVPATQRTRRMGSKHDLSNADSTREQRSMMSLRTRRTLPVMVLRRLLAFSRDPRRPVRVPLPLPSAVSRIGVHGRATLRLLGFAAAHANITAVMPNAERASM